MENPMLDHIDIDTIEIAQDTLTGDVRDALLAQIRTMPKAYGRLTQDEQQEVIEHATKVATNLVERAVQVIAAQGRKALVGQLIKVQVKDNIQCQINFSKSDALRHDLYDSQGLAVILVIADAKPFTGEQAPAEPESDQAVIPLHLARDNEGDNE